LATSIVHTCMNTSMAPIRGGHNQPTGAGDLVELASVADPWFLAVIATPTDWVLSLAEYSIFIRPDLLQQFWQVMSDGGFITDAVAVIDTSRRTGRRVLVDAGGVRPRRGRGLKGRCLTFAEREEIALARAAGESMRSIADRLGRSASTISRELGRNLDRQGRYRSTAAPALAYDRAGRPKPAKLVTNLALRAKVEQDLQKKYSPEQITGRLLVEFPDDPEMRVSPETIYQSLYVQSRGALKRELTACLRTGRALRRPSRKVGQRKNRIPNMINVSERPAEVEDRAVPGNCLKDGTMAEADATLRSAWSPDGSALVRLWPSDSIPGKYEMASLPAKDGNIAFLPIGCLTPFGIATTQQIADAIVLVNGVPEKASMSAKIASQAVVAKAFK
jgi:hypothetical protein